MSTIANVRKNLVRLRARSGLTLVELSKLSKVGPVAINAIERGRIGASIKVIERIARALKVEPASIFLKRCKRVRRGPSSPKLASVVSDNITLLRLNKLMTQAKLAQRTGIQGTVISQLERGYHTPQLGTLDRLATGLGLKGAAVFLGKPTAGIDRIRKYVQLAEGVYTWTGYRRRTT